MKINHTNLLKFIKTAGSATYAGGGSYEKIPERPGFLELVYQENDWHYRDSYTGFYRSRGTETVRYQNQVVWVSQYGGGIENGFENRAGETFNFLKSAILHNNNSIKQTFRGPRVYAQDDWSYTYHQEGEVEDFWGLETIKYKHKIVFTHRIIGGTIVGKEE